MALPLDSRGNRGREGTGVSVRQDMTLGVAGGVRGRVPPFAGWRLPEQDLPVSLNRYPRDYSQQLRGCPWEGTGLGEQGLDWWWQRGTFGSLVVVLTAPFSVPITADLLPRSLQQ